MIHLSLIALAECSGILLFLSLFFCRAQVIIAWALVTLALAISCLIFPN